MVYRRSIAQFSLRRFLAFAVLCCFLAAYLRAPLATYLKNISSPNSKASQESSASDLRKLIDEWERRWENDDIDPSTRTRGGVI